MLSRLLLKFLGKIDGHCMSCGGREIEFSYDEEIGCYALMCKICKSKRISDISFSHAGKIFRVDYVENARVISSSK